MNRIILALLLSCALPAWGACSGSGLVWSCTANSTAAQVQSALDSATAGAIITFDAGTGTWSTNLSVSKGVSLIGAGSGCPDACTTSAGNSTTITCTTGFCVSYQPSDPNANLLFRVSGFVFDMNNQGASGVAAYAITLSGGNTLVKQTKMRVDHNKFQGMNNTTCCQTHWFQFYDAFGVVDNNYFGPTYYMVRTPTSVILNGSGTCGVTRECSGEAEWNHWEGIAFGRADNELWFEDNIINLDGASEALLSDCQEGNRYAWRYNTITIPAGDQSYSMMDMHGNGGQVWGCMGSEIYGNKLTGGAGGNWMDQRGGRMFNFLNQLPTSGGWAINVRDECLDSGNPVNYDGPNPPQYELKPNKSYYWGNRAGATGSLTGINHGACADVGCGAGCATTIVADVNYHYYNGSFDGSSGMGCGTLAARPSTCTTNVAYWATNQSCSDLTGLVGHAPSTPISGSLYICTATNTWDAGTAPLAYPHPLIGGGSAPSAPTGFHIVSED